MTNSNDTKEAFYEELDKATHSVLRNDKLILLGDFNTKVGRDYNPGPTF